MAGKAIIFILILLLVYNTKIAANPIAEMKGGLIFERPLPQAVMVNPQSITFSRELDLNPFIQASNTIKEITFKYVSFCNK